MKKRFIAKVFRTGGSQAVRLPKECQLPGREVSVVREDDRLILQPINPRGWSREFLEMISTPASANLFGARAQPPTQERDFDS
jgi:virulence-associated protein VagC